MSKNSIPLNDLIKELNRSYNKLDKSVEKDINNIFAQIVYEIGKATAYDTNVTRNLFMTILKTHFKRSDLSAKLYKDPYEHWNTVEERLAEGDNYVLNKQMVKGRLVYGLVINSDAFNYLDTIPNSVSTRHPRGNDTNLRPLMTEYVMDLFEHSSNEEIEKLVMQFEDKLIRVLEGL